MKNHAMALHAGAGPAQDLTVDTYVSFLFWRQRVIHLMPTEAASRPGYIWRKVFLKEKRHV